MKNYVGIVGFKNDEIYLDSLHRKDKFSKLFLKKKKKLSLKDGDIVCFDDSQNPQIRKKIGHIQDKDIFLKIAAHRNNIPIKFSKTLEESLKELSIPDHDSKRLDLREYRFITIDGEDAKDFDDAVFVEKMANQEWKIIVGIADVSYYVPSGSPLDKEAYKRSNSVYFANSAVPMLPSMLSDNLCSLLPRTDRAVLCVEMRISNNGELKKSNFFRALIRSQERLTYEELQKAIDGVWLKKTKPFEEEIQNLYAVYKILKKNSIKRGVLNIDKPDYKISFSKSENPKGIKELRTGISNEIIEELMILANYCAGKVLEGTKTIFRVHPPVADDRLIMFENMLKKQKLNLPKSKDRNPSKIFNAVLKKLEGNQAFHFMQDIILRCQQQAFYTTDNIGHSGLALDKYCHFTSPIRRYADLVVHRCLINALDIEETAQSLSCEGIEKIGDYISENERKAISAEKECFERYACYLLKKKEGGIFDGRISGISQQGLFVLLKGFGVEGFVRVSTMDDYYHYDETNQRFIGRRSKRIYQVGQNLKVQLLESNFLKCQISLKIIDLKKKSVKQRKRNRRKEKRG